MRTYNQTDAYNVVDVITSGLRLESGSDLTLRVTSTLTNNVVVNCAFDVVLIRR